MTPQEETSCIEAVRAGDTAAFARLVHAHQSYAFHLAMRVTRNREDAEEAAQDAFVKAYRKLDSFREGARFSTWLYRIVYNCAISRLRKRPHHNVVDEPPPIHEADPAAVHGVLQTLRDEERKHYLEQALSLLSPTDATLLDMYYFQELNVAEIAEVSNLGTSNVKTRLHRGRKALYQHLEAILREEAREIL